MLQGLKSQENSDLVFVLDNLFFFVLAAGRAHVMRTFGFATACAGNNLNCRQTIVDGTAHHRAGMGNTFLRYCHFLLLITE